MGGRWFVGLFLASTLFAGCFGAPGTADPLADQGNVTPTQEPLATTATEATTDDGLKSMPPSGSRSGSVSAGPDCHCGCPWVDGCTVPAVTPGSGVRFLLNATYASGENVSFRVVNERAENVSYAWTTIREDIGIYSDTGRRIWLGADTDVTWSKWIAPGATENLTTWDGRDCLRDGGDWYARSCAESVPVKSGLYQVREQFCAIQPGPKCLYVWAGAAFRIASN